jgi:Flp pilus assembly protein TadD
MKRPVFFISLVLFFLLIGGFGPTLAQAQGAPRSAQDFLAQGDRFLKEKNYPKAMEAYRQAVRLNPNLAGAHRGLGYALGKLNRWPEGVEAYKQAVALDPMQAEYHNGLGYAYLQME